MPRDPTLDDEVAASSADYDELRKFVPAHPRARRRTVARRAARLSAVGWLLGLGWLVVRRLRPRLARSER